MESGLSPEEGSQDVLQIFIRPNRSLRPETLWVLLAAFTALALVIGTGFAIVGAWLVLPFMGLEIAVIGAVLWYLHRHADDCEVLVVDEERVRIIQREGGTERRQDFPRYWARARLARAGQGWYPSRLLIGSHGRFVEVAAAMGEEERRALYWRLKRVMGEGRP